MKACSTFRVQNDALIWKTHSLHYDKKIFVTHVCRILNNNNIAIRAFTSSNKHYCKQVGFIPCTISYASTVQSMSQSFNEYITQLLQLGYLHQWYQFLVQIPDHDTFSSWYHQLCWMAAASRTMEGCLENSRYCLVHNQLHPIGDYRIWWAIPVLPVSQK